MTSTVIEINTKCYRKPWGYLTEIGGHRKIHKVTNWKASRRGQEQKMGIDGGRSMENNTWILSIAPYSFKKVKLTAQIRKKSNLKYFHYLDCPSWNLGKDDTLLYSCPVNKIVLKFDMTIMTMRMLVAWR